jgi:hypothetical protein
MEVERIDVFFGLQNMTIMLSLMHCRCRCIQTAKTISILMPFINSPLGRLPISHDIHQS